MKDLVERFTLECRTNNSGKLKKFKPNFANKEIYKYWFMKLELYMILLVMI